MLFLPQSVFALFKTIGQPCKCVRKNISKTELLQSLNLKKCHYICTFEWQTDKILFLILLQREYGNAGYNDVHNLYVFLPKGQDVSLFTSFKGTKKSKTRERYSNHLFILCSWLSVTTQLCIQYRRRGKATNLYCLESIRRQVLEVAL